VSRENVEIVRGLLDAFARRDHESAFALYDPEIEFDATEVRETIPDLAGVYHGHDGVRTYWRRWLSAWSELTFEIDDVIDAGDSVVALISNQHQKGRLSGIDTSMPRYAIVFTFRDGKVVRWKNYLDPERAFAAVGVSPP
jgi:ketosteroid isomerase-like protein